MATNIITMIGKAPRQPEVPPFTPKITGEETDDLKALFVFSHHQAACHALNCISEIEGPDRAIALLLDLISDLQKRRVP